MDSQFFLTSTLILKVPHYAQQFYIFSACEARPPHPPYNSRYIEYIGYSIITLGLWYGVQELAGSYFKVNFFESNPEILERLSSVAIESGDLLTYHFSIDIMMMFIGVLVWIIGRVFKYGTYLQEEYDQTV